MSEQAADSGELATTTATRDEDEKYLQELTALCQQKVSRSGDSEVNGRRQESSTWVLSKLWWVPARSGLLINVTPHFSSEVYVSAFAQVVSPSPHW